MRKKKEVKSFLFLVIFSLAFVGLFMAISMISVKFLLRKTKVVKNEVFDYKSVSFSPETNETNYGFVSLSFIVPDEGISYMDSNGNYNLISRNENEEYVCHGSCTCEYEKSQRKSSATSSLFRKPIIYLVAAISSSLAYKRATDHFHENCELELGLKSDEECISGSIQSEIESCVQMVKTGPGRRGFRPSPLRIFTTEEIMPDQEWESHGEYECHGRCLSYNKENLVKCERLEITETVKYYRYHKKGQMQEILAEVHPTFDPVRKRFQKFSLDPFCESGSLFLMMEDDEQETALREESQFEESDCCAVPPGSKFEINPSIICYQKYFTAGRRDFSKHYQEYENYILSFDSDEDIPY